MKPTAGKFDAVVIGASAGGLEALSTVLATLPTDLAAPVVVVQHRAPDAGDRLSEILDRRCRLPVGPAEDKMPLDDGRIYVAPAGYHLLVEKNRTLSLSVDPRVNHARPSVDVLFDSAADAYHDRLVGIVLTGAGKDGATGLKRIAALGGTAIIQDPEGSAVASMPDAARTAVPGARIASLSDIGPLIVELCRVEGASDE